jgi:hypothetical protein
MRHGSERSRGFGTFAFTFAFAFAGCVGAEEGGIPDRYRLVTGRALVVGETAGTQRHAMQLVAVFAADQCDGDSIRVGDATPDGSVAACAIFGEPFDPGEQGGGVPAEPFRLLLPCNVTVNLVVQLVASSEARTPGDLLAILAWPDGAGVSTLHPRENGSDLAEACRDTELRATNLIDLGDVTIPAEPPDDGPATVIAGGAEGGVNPLGTVDTDGDTDANLADPDDDDDDLLDEADDDDDGDGAVDAAQVFDLAWWPT